ncbi:uncharacterized protein [Diadema antillarum]|uniref:uncharacterized protein isoform X2 n=1 Tax=Diadema antillarum TaxID=105358 RepID=UPI003A87DDBF
MYKSVTKSKPPAPPTSCKDPLLSFILFPLMKDDEDIDSGTMVARGRSKATPAGIDDEEEDSGTMIISGSAVSTANTFIEHDSVTDLDSGTMIEHASGTMIEHDTDTMINHDSGSMIEHESGTMIEHGTGTINDLESNMGTMVINEDEGGNDDTMKRTDTAKAGGYRPPFLEHYDRQEEAKQQSKVSPPGPAPINPSNAPTVPSNAPMHIAQGNHRLKHLSIDELRDRLASLDPQMEAEIEELRKRYQEKRRPIIEAMEVKRKRQQHF